MLNIRLNFIRNARHEALDDRQQNEKKNVNQFQLNADIEKIG